MAACIMAQSHHVRVSSNPKSQQRRASTVHPGHIAFYYDNTSLRVKRTRSLAVKFRNSFHHLKNSHHNEHGVVRALDSKAKMQDDDRRETGLAASTESSHARRTVSSDTRIRSIGVDARLGTTATQGLGGGSSDGLYNHLPGRNPPRWSSAPDAGLLERRGIDNSFSGNSMVTSINPSILVTPSSASSDNDSFSNGLMVLPTNPSTLVTRYSGGSDDGSFELRSSLRFQSDDDEEAEIGVGSARTTRKIKANIIQIRSNPTSRFIHNGFDVSPSGPQKPVNQPNAGIKRENKPREASDCADSPDVLVPGSPMVLDDVTRRSAKYGLGATLRSAKDARELIMGDKSFTGTSLDSVHKSRSSETYSSVSTNSFAPQVKLETLNRNFNSPHPPRGSSLPVSVKEVNDASRLPRPTQANLARTAGNGPLRKSHTMASIKKIGSRITSILPSRSRSSLPLHTEITDDSTVDDDHIDEGWGFPSAEESMATSATYRHALPANSRSDLATYNKDAMASKFSVIACDTADGSFMGQPSDKEARRESEHDEYEREAVDYYVGQAQWARAARQRAFIEQQGRRQDDDEQPPTPPGTGAGPRGHYVEEDEEDSEEVEQVSRRLVAIQLGGQRGITGGRFQQTTRQQATIQDSDQRGTPQGRPQQISRRQAVQQADQRSQAQDGAPHQTGQHERSQQAVSQLAAQFGLAVTANASSNDTARSTSDLVTRLLGHTEHAINNLLQNAQNMRDPEERRRISDLIEAIGQSAVLLGNTATATLRLSDANEQMLMNARRLAEFGAAAIDEFGQNHPQ